MEAHHTLICVPLNGIQVKTSLVIDSPSVSSRRGYSSYGIVDTKTIWFVFLLILPDWRVFFLGSPALHNAGTDRLQMVGVRSLHVDRSWLLVFLSWSESGLQSSTPDSSWSTSCLGGNPKEASCLFTFFFLESCNKKYLLLEIWIKCIWSYCMWLNCGSIATSREEAGRRKKNKEPPDVQKDSPVY